MTRITCGLLLFIVSQFVFFITGSVFSQDYLESFDTSAFTQATSYGPVSGSEGWVDNTWVKDSVNGDQALSINWSPNNDVGHRYNITYSTTIYSMAFYVQPKEGKQVRINIGENHAGSTDNINLVFNSAGADGVESIAGHVNSGRVFYVQRLSRKGISIKTIL